ncbi:hypothetical protein ACSDQ9_00415 [Aestuariimicrobium soli]|uniref:hypothetical protein n=1 Tax=Aestuariimicrobium soli TaxID=2035834 RepID=UPI003EC0959B
MVSMVIAHTAPVGGVFNVTEFLTMPWFALLMGCGLALAWQRTKARDPGTPWWWFGVTGTLRGLVLIALGELLDPVYDQVLVVLQYLVCAQIAAVWLTPLLGSRPRLGWALTVAVWLGGAPVVQAAIALQTTIRTGWRGTLLQWLAAGPDYRAITMLVWMLGGISMMAGRAAPRAEGSARSLRWAVALTGVTAVWQLVGKLAFPDTFLPYSGTLFETGHNLVLALAASLWCRWLAERFPAVVDRAAAVSALGRLALTGYVAQLLVLEEVQRLVLHGARDDHWWVLGVTVAVLLGGAWAWERLGWPRPVEAVPRAMVTGADWLRHRWTTRAARHAHHVP